MQIHCFGDNIMIKRIKNVKEIEARKSIKDLKGKKEKDLSSSDIKKIVGYLAKKFKII